MIATIQGLPRWARAFAAVIAVAGLGLAYWLISPLFINVSVNEALPGTGTSSAAATTATTSADLSALGSGAFYDVSHDGVKGKATLYKQADGSIILRLTDFRVLNGPDLYVYGSSLTRPGAGDVNASNSVILGKLKGNVGDQNYAVPAGTQLDKLKSIVIWCKTFSVNFASASL